MTRIAAAAAALVLAGALGGCGGPVDTTARCAELASTYLDPAWAPRTVVALPKQPESLGIHLTITAQGRSVDVVCSQGMVMSGPIFTGEVTIQGRAAEPGQLYRVDQDRWLTEDERQARIKTLLAPQPGEFAGQAWQTEAADEAPNTVPSPTGGCFHLASNTPPRRLSTCATAEGRRYWMSQGGMEAEEAGPPADAPPLPA